MKEMDIMTKTTTTTAAPRFVVEKDEYGMPCEHPLCDTLHRRYMTRGIAGDLFHETKRVDWVVIDTTTGERADGELSDAWSTKREALEAIERFLARPMRQPSFRRVPAAAVDTQTCESCGRDLPVTKFPTRSTKNGVVRGTVCRECRDAVKGTRACGPWCREAVADKCECACNGENHGIDHDAA